MQTVDLATIAKKAHLHPRQARARLRRAKPGQLPKPTSDARWEWSPAKAPKVIEYLRAS